MVVEEAEASADEASAEETSEGEHDTDAAGSTAVGKESVRVQSLSCISGSREGICMVDHLQTALLINANRRASVWSNIYRYHR